MALALGLTGAAWLVVTWLAYPAAVAVIARLMRRSVVPPLASLPSATCVLAAREQPARIEGRVRSWLSSDYPGPLDVVVALDPSSTDRWAPPPDLADRVQVVTGDDPGGKCANLNAGVRSARGEILIMGDAHQAFAPDAIRRLVARFGDPRIGAVAGQLEIPADAAGFVSRLYWNYERGLRANEARIHSTIGVSGAIYAVRRALWEPLPAGLILDDVHLPMRLVLGGHRVAFETGATARESRRVEARQEFRRKVRTLTGNYQLCLWLPAVLVPVRNPVWLQFVLHKLARLGTPFALLACLLGAVLAIPALPRALATALLGSFAVGAALLAFSPDPVSRRLRTAAMLFGGLVAAPAVALVNALRGEWDVWQPHARR